MEDTNKMLGKIFGSPARAKVLRFFMQNPGVPFPIPAVAGKCGLSAAAALREVSALRAAGILRRKTIRVKTGKGKRQKGKPIRAWYVNEQFPHRAALEKFFADALLLDEQHIVRQIQRVGRIRYIVLSGVFSGLPDGRVDLLVVGDVAHPSALGRALKKIESHVCRELRLAYLPTGDYYYRRNVSDRLLRDVFDYPHKIALDRLGTLMPTKNHSF